MRRLNDSLGHAAGDQLLQRLASRLRACVPQGDTLARLGGDEFAFLLSGLKREVEAARRAKEILDALSAPIRLAEIDCRISASVGVAMFPGDGSAAEDLIGNAERAMYQAKERGGARFEFHAPQQGEAARARMELENDLRSALVSGQLLAYFQPKVRVADMRVSGVEALMRWRHPERGFVPPAHFIPVAEEAGLIGKIGDWILHAACAQGAAWQTGPSAGISVAVNVSSRQLEDHRFVSEVHAALERSGLPPACLELEVTESALMRDVGASRRILASLKERGVRVAIDDFGTGYSSLSALRSLPVDCLKIDRSFVSGIAEGATDAKLVCLVIAMAQSLGLETVAEGVETPEQAEFLAAHGCDLLQGYLFSEALPPEALEGRLEAPMTWERKRHDGGEG
jgi:diguanylate cyclase (GGDEF)-like protein